MAGGVPILAVKAQDFMKKMYPFKVRMWNVYTLMDNARTDRPEGRTALIARELQRYNISIAALSRMWLAAEGQINEEGAGYIFFWSEWENDECRGSNHICN